MSDTYLDELSNLEGQRILETADPVSSVGRTACRSSCNVPVIVSRL